MGRYIVMTASEYGDDPFILKKVFDSVDAVKDFLGLAKFNLENYNHVIDITKDELEVVAIYQASPEFDGGNFVKYNLKELPVNDGVLLRFDGD